MSHLLGEKKKQVSLMSLFVMCTLCRRSYLEDPLQINPRINLFPRTTALRKSGRIVSGDSCDHISRVITITAHKRMVGSTQETGDDINKRW